MPQPRPDWLTAGPFTSVHWALVTGHLSSSCCGGDGGGDMVVVMVVTVVPVVGW